MKDRSKEIVKKLKQENLWNVICFILCLIAGGLAEWQGNWVMVSAAVFWCLIFIIKGYINVSISDTLKELFDLDKEEK